MSEAPKILAFAGSARRDSANKKLAAVAAKAAEAAGAEVTLIDLADYPAAVYNGDDEDANGLPETMRALKRLIGSHDGLVIATPEYNGALPPLLVNAFSWASRREGEEEALAVFKDKPVAIMAASPGGLGGVRVVSRMRDYVAQLGCIAIRGFVNLGGAYDAFDAQGALTREAASRQVTGLTQRLVRTAAALR